MFTRPFYLFKNKKLINYINYVCAFPMKMCINKNNAKYSEKLHLNDENGTVSCGHYF